MGQGHTIMLGDFLMIMGTSLVVAGVKYCSVFSQSGGLGKQSHYH